jgi:hypothetical protein
VYVQFEGDSTMVEELRGPFGPAAGCGFGVTQLDIAMGTRNPSTQWVLPDKETGMELYFYPRVHK